MKWFIFNVENFRSMGPYDEDMAKDAAKDLTKFGAEHGGRGPFKAVPNDWLEQFRNREFHLALAFQLEGRLE